VKRHLVRAATVAGHHGWPVPVVAVAGLRVSGPQLWLPVLLVSTALWLVHLRGICPRCVQRMPDLPAVQAARHARALGWVHRPWQPLTWAVIAVDLTVAVAGARWLVASAVIGAVGAGALMWALDRHARLQPWCPQCGHGGLGDDAVCLAPTGQGGGVR
jgi:hypothetical protein